MCYGKPTKYPPLGEGGVYIDALSSQSTPRKKKVPPNTEMCSGSEAGSYGLEFPETLEPFPPLRPVTCSCFHV